MDDHVDGSVRWLRLRTGLMAAAGATALVLACLTASGLGGTGGTASLIAVLFGCYLLLLAAAAIPAALALRQLVDPRTEASAGWGRALLAPACAGLLLGFAASEVWPDPDPAPGGLWLVTEIGVQLFLSALCTSLVLVVARVPRPWLTGSMGTVVGALLVGGYLLIAADGTPPVAVWVVAGGTGALVAALTVGPVLRPTLRLAVYALCWVIVLCGNAARPIPSTAADRAAIEQLAVPLVAPDLPGWFVERAEAVAGRLEVTMAPDADRYAAPGAGGPRIQVTVLAAPTGFAPPTRCAPFAVDAAPAEPCREVSTGVWEDASGTYAVRQGVGFLVLVSGPAAVVPLREAAESLRPVTAEQLVP
ncbi:hypothetical protein F4553_000180 [Allocatelliglobosispora scoriae]|uniref:Uncharacterized protein n=1 Tax=Allocatelliglobosispora scoriae TaxID=643052 RepID=A0A841BIS2_9ACTN|nr:hypothetical protein [Allocatelliglobosispora scoriae]MBB5866801.1 hypothetical protein [Allocatelliglobosispora scoriae]